MISRSCTLAAFLLCALAGQALASPPGTAFTYQGQVKSGGSAMNGAVPMTFTLWDASAGGVQVGSEISFDGVGANPPPVTVANGLFTVALDFGQAACANQARWLQVTVNGQTLTPRQAMTPAPFALNTRGINVDGAGNSSFNGNMTVQADSAAEVPSQLLIRHATNPDLQLMIGYASNGYGEYGSIQSIHQGWDFMPLCINPIFGNVGIGTFQPNAPFHVVAHHQYPTARLTAASDSYGGPALSLDATNLANGQEWILGCQDRFTLRHAPEAEPKMVVTPDGTVGIGTYGPAATLHVVSHTGTPLTCLLQAGPEAIWGSWLVLDASALPGGQPWVVSSTAGTAPEGQGKFVVGPLNSPVLTLTSSGNMAVGGTDPGSFRLAVNGTAANSTGSWSIFSDARLKQNITALTPGTLDRMLSLHGAEFEYTPEAVRDRHMATGRTVGFIAQEVEKVFPEWVSLDDEGYRYVTERGTTALMVEALRDLRAEKDAQIAGLTAQVADLNARLARLEAAVGK